LGELKTLVTKIESDVLRVPREMREILGHDTKIVVGTAAVLAFSAATSYSDVLRSLELIQDDIRLRQAEKDRKLQDQNVPKHGKQRHLETQR
jgi:hypothetical protein